MKTLTLDLTDILGTLDRSPETLAETVRKVHDGIHAKTLKGSDFLGWLDLPGMDKTDEYARIKEAAKRIRNQADILVVIGIGGSYLGTRAALDFLKRPFKDDGLEIVFAGHNMSADHLNGLLEYLKGKRYAINVISKSGTTTEPAIAFRILKNALENAVGKEEARKRIYAITDKARGALFKLARSEGYEMFVIPDDVGGRYSVLSPVGLLPLSAKGIDTDLMLKGAQDAKKAYDNPELSQNDAYLYAVSRHLLYTQGKKIEMLVGYEPALSMFNEWWKQLFGESEGKDGKGLFVASASFSTDLHSLGQYIQDGERHLFETVIKVSEPASDVTVPNDPDDLDGLNYIAGKTLSYVNHQALKGTMMAHKDGGVPNILITIPKLDAHAFGTLVYFFEKACAMSAHLLGVNPFDQPGVEAYKTNMFALLGKKGYGDILKKG